MRLPIIAVTPALLLLSACHKFEMPGASPVDAGLSAMIPADTTVLVGARLDELRKTPMYEKYFSKIPLPQLDEFTKQTGLDPRTDLSEILLCSNGQDAGVLIVRGKFVPATLEAKIEERGATRTKYKDHSLLGDERHAITFLNSTTAIGGSIPRLKAMIDANGNLGGVPQRLRALVDSLSPNAQLWAVFNGSLPHPPLPDEGPAGVVNQLVRGLQEGTFTADLRSGLDIRARGTCSLEKDAKQIRDGLKGVIGIGRLSTPDDQMELLKVFDGINVEQNGRAVEVTAVVPQPVVDHFVDMFFKAGGARRLRHSD